MFLDVETSFFPRSGTKIVLPPLFLSPIARAESLPTTRLGAYSTTLLQCVLTKEVWVSTITLTKGLRRG